MKDAENIISSCRHCLFYETQGRRGGQCRQLGVPVQGCWKSCALAASPFASRWRDLERMVALHTTTLEASLEELEVAVDEKISAIEI